MKGAFLLIVGVVVGFVVAHQVSHTPQGKQFFDDVNSRAHGFGDSIVDGYKAREAELRETANGVVSDLGARAR